MLVTGLALAYAIYTAVLLRKGAEAARKRILEQFEGLLLKPPQPTEDSPAVSPEQIKLLMERIRGTRKGAFAPFSNQPALQALLLPFGGYGSVQLIEYLLVNTNL